jgi:hypothetical protein
MAEPSILPEPKPGDADPDVRRAERYAALILGLFIPVLLGVIALALGGLLLAPKDDSTFGLLRALVFRCH